MIDAKTQAELVELRHAAKDASDIYTEAVKVAAAKNQLDAQGLNRYIRAVAGDSLDKLNAEMRTLGQLGLDL